MVTASRCILVCLTSFALLRAAPSCAARQDAQLWLTTGLDFNLNERTRVVMNYDLRLADDLKRVAIEQVSGGVSRRIFPDLSVGLAYGWVSRNPSTKGDGSERRVTEELLWLPHGARGLSMRSRLEQSFSSTGRTGWRFREKLRLSAPIEAGAAVYAFGSGEIFFNMTDTERKPAGLDQFRLSAGGGLRIARSTNVEVGYVNQYVPRRDGRTDRINHALSVSLKWNP